MTVRLDYRLDKLREQITAKRDRRVEQALADYAAAADLAGRRDAWRDEQERRVRALARNVKNLRDTELESFRIPECPAQRSRYSSPEGTRDEALDRAHKAYDRAIRRLDAVHAPSGVLSLTANMLTDWFGL